MQNLDQANQMLDIFASVGAGHFDVTFLDIDGAKRGFRKAQSMAQLKNSLPLLLPGLTERQNSLVVRPIPKVVSLVQLDDLDAAGLERVGAAAFLLLATSPGNHQAWVAVCGASDKDFARRLRKQTGADASASGATRLAGTVNYKRKYEPGFPIVSIVCGVPGRVTTPEGLQGFGLLAEPEPVKIAPAPRRISPNQHRPWPSYEISLMRAPKKPDGTPDRSKADINWCLTSLTGGKDVEETILRLLEVSERARERAAGRDPGYARVTVENAGKMVARNWGRNRA